ncbi:unnamed protein product [Echinostoma caproni]|uniref:ELM2 domain-containing protein n=1 Tax=Echinostoma caproni TaxID=27848 RepID=A0A183B9V7_9TREM|nr:unnamed protein product [Echinostoma caproni]
MKRNFENRTNTGISKRPGNNDASEIDHVAQTNLSEKPRGSSGASCSSSDDDSDDEAVYFVAGKYDPVHRRVVAWDPDIARMIKPP